MSAGDALLFHRPITWANFRADKMGTVMCALIVAVNPIRSSDEITVVGVAR